MSLPSTGFDLATIPAPSADITGFSPIIDHANDSASYIADINTTDGTRGRIAKHSDGSEYAKDPIGFVDSTDRGLTRFFFGTILAASTVASRQIRKYPPNTRNTAYGVSDTYGQYNTYDSNWEGYWPDGGGVDRTSSSNDGSAQGGVTFGGASGQVGKATSYDGINDVSQITGVGTEFPRTLSMWANVQTHTNFARLMAQASSLGDCASIALFNVSGRVTSAGETTSQNSNTFSLTSWQSMSSIFTSESSVSMLINDSDNSTTGTTALIQGNVPDGDMSIGGRWDASFIESLIQEVQVHSVVRTTAWRSEEYTQTDDNATFWGTWTWNAPPSGGIVIFRRRIAA